MKKSLLVLMFLCGSALVAVACPFCNPQIRKGIYNSQFYPNLLAMLSAFVVLAIVVFVLSRIATKRHATIASTSKTTPYFSPVPLTTASMVLGIGIGGFLDGIVLHQILQWHEMLSNKIPSTNYVGKSINMFWDGIFHLFCLLVVLTGVVLLWKLLLREKINRSGYLLSGGLLLGWGVFNIIEGIIDHHLLKLHNVFELSNSHDFANFLFLGLSVLLLIVGSILSNFGIKGPMHQRSEQL